MDKAIAGVIRDLQNIERKMANKIIKTAQREAVKVLQRQIMSTAPVNTGLLKRSVKVRAGKRRKNSVSMLVTIDGGHVQGFVGQVEFGNKEHGENAFIRNAVAHKRNEVLDVFVAKLNEGLQGA